MSRTNLAATDVHRAASHSRRSEPGHRRRGTDQIDDRIEGANLVEVHRFGGHAVNAALGLGQAPEQRDRSLAHLRVERTTIQQGLDLGQRPPVSVRRLTGVVRRMGVRVRMLVRVGVMMRVRFRGTYPTLGCFFLGIEAFDRTAVLDDLKSQAANSLPHRRASRERDTREFEPRDRFAQHLGRHPEVQAGAEEHVARHAAPTVEVKGISHGARQ